MGSRRRAREPRRPGAAEVRLHLAQLERPTRRVDPAEQLVEALPVDVGEGLAHRPAEQGAPADEVGVATVDEFEDVLGAGEHGDGHGRLCDEGAQAAALGLDPGPWLAPAP